MDYTATAKYVRMGTRKLRLVADAIRKLPVGTALVTLQAMPKHAAQPLADVVRSAVANAKQKQAKEETLRFKTIEIMGGPAMKRFRAVSRGQGHGYKKRMTHVRVILTDTDRKQVQEGA